MNKRILLLLSAVILLSVVSCKKDAEVNKDTFKIENEKVTATTQSVSITGTYVYSGAIDGITVELGRQSDLMDGDAYRALLEDTDFSVEMKNLRTNTTYYYRYSVEYGGKTPYLTDIKSFKTLEYNLPEVASQEVVSVGVNCAEISGEVLSDGGGDAVTLRGICWSTIHNPSVGDEYANAGEGIGTFTCELTNLQPEKTYYARAFAGNSKGVSYGEELTFMTLAAGSLAEVRTVGITGNAMLQATVNGEVTNEGTSAVIERGVCYGKGHYPTTGGLHVSSGSGMGEYSCQLMNLEANATYYVRAYAINSLGSAYGEEMSFVAMMETTAPVVTTNMVNGITQSSATGHGTVVSDGGATVTRRGLCWSTEHNPTVDDIHADCGSGVGDFSGLMPHLANMTTYYVRAYAENAIGMAYGDEVSFTVGQHNVQVDVSATPSNGGTVTGGGTYQQGQQCTVTATANSGYVFLNWTENGSEVSTEAIYAFTVIGDRILVANFTLQVLPPTVVTDPVTDITQTTAMGGGTVTSDGNATVTERGICWSTSHNPTTSDDHASNGTGTGSFSVNMTGLTPNTTYYVRAYAINAQGITYGDEVSFVTSDLPQYTINVSANPSEGGTTMGGGTYQQGQQCTLSGSSNTGYTFVNWTENDSVVSSNSNYTFTVTRDRNLVANFMLQTTLPTVSTNPVTNIAQTTATGGGNVTSDGNATVTERGVCWSTSHNPTINNSHVSSGAGTGSFTVNMTNLTMNTAYYLRAYAINEVGVGYGSEVSFHTLLDSYVEDFETGNFSQFDWQLGSNYPWQITTTDPYEGTYCMKSGNQGVNSSTSEIQVTIEIPADGQISFYCKISSEGGWDRGYFTIDGAQMDTYGGVGSWGERVFNITAGTHTFKWGYTKDSSVSGNDDCFYVDRITFYRPR